MRSWQLARVRTTCGHCGQSIPKDSPVQLISQIGLTRVLRRCQACAEGVCDPGQIVVLPSFEARWKVKEGQAFTPVSQMADDFKMRQTGEREPGEDDA